MKYEPILHFHLSNHSGKDRMYRFKLSLTEILQKTDKATSTLPLSVDTSGASHGILPNTN